MLGRLNSTFDIRIESLRPDRIRSNAAMAGVSLPSYSVVV